MAKNKIFINLLLFFLLSCNNMQKKSCENKAFFYDSLQSGVLICRLGNGFFSNYFRNYASKEKKFSHIGIISKENDSLFVYHSEASELTGVGKVKREHLSSFLNGIKVFSFFEFTYHDTVVNNILSEIKSYYLLNTPFDLDFNSLNDNQLYCSELIAVSINKTLKKDVIKPSIIIKNKKIFSLDDIYLNSKVKNIDDRIQIIDK